MPSVIGENLDWSSTAFISTYWSISADSSGLRLKMRWGVIQWLTKYAPYYITLADIYPPCILLQLTFLLFTTSSTFFVRVYLYIRLLLPLNRHYGREDGLGYPPDAISSRLWHDGWRRYNYLLSFFLEWRDWIALVMLLSYQSSNPMDRLKMADLYRRSICLWYAG